MLAVTTPAVAAMPVGVISVMPMISVMPTICVTPMTRLIVFACMVGSHIADGLGGTERGGVTQGMGIGQCVRAVSLGCTAVVAGRGRGRMLGFGRFFCGLRLGRRRGPAWLVSAEGEGERCQQCKGKQRDQEKAL